MWNPPLKPKQSATISAVKFAVDSCFTSITNVFATARRMAHELERSKLKLNFKCICYNFEANKVCVLSLIVK